MSASISANWRGFRLVCWAGVDYQGARRAGTLGERSLPQEAEELAQVVGADGREPWRLQAAAGGAGEQWLAILDVSLNALTVLLAVPDQLAKAWTLYRRLLARLRRQRHVEWEAGPEIGLLRCLSAVRRRIRNPIFSVETIRIVEDGTKTTMWSDMPRGLHVIIIPELRTQRTFIFAVDEEPQIVGSMVVDRLTADASEYAPRRIARRRQRPATTGRQAGSRGTKGASRQPV